MSKHENYRFKITVGLGKTSYPVGIYPLKVNNRNTRTRCEICSKLTIKRHQNNANGVVLMFLLLTLNTKLPAG